MVSPKRAIALAAVGIVVSPWAPVEAMAMIAAPSAAISSSAQAVIGRPVASVMIWRHSGLRVPPPIAPIRVTGTPVEACIASMSRAISMLRPSRIERYIAARSCEPRQPMKAPRAMGSQ